MISSEQRECNHCGKFHLRNISFFAYWVKCKKCGTYFCPRCSGYWNPKATQFTFFAYMLISEIFYLGIFFIFGPIKGGISLFSAYIFAGILLFIPFIFLLFRIQSATRLLSRQPEALINCPKCNASTKVISHDIFLYFFIFLIHVLYLSTIFNETGIFFYNLVYYGSGYGLSLSLMFITLLVVPIIFIIWLFKRIGGRILPKYKMNARAWLGEIYAIFLYLTLTVIFFLFLAVISNIIVLTQLMNDTLVLYILFYNITSIVFWYFPAFLIAGIIYKIAQKYLLNVNKSKIIQIFITILYIIISFYLWGLISLTLGIYSDPTFYSNLFRFYSSIFNEIIPLLSFSILLGISISSVFRKIISNNSKIQQNSYLKIIILIGISFLIGFLIFENIYYFINGSLFLDNSSPFITPTIIIIILIGSLVLIFYEILSNWISSKTRWGELLEKKLGSLLYTILMGFIIIALSLSFSVIVLISTSKPLLSAFDLTVNRFLLKSFFTVGLMSGLIIGLKK